MTSTSPPAQTLNWLFVYHFFPHYREGVLRSLAQHPSICPSFTAAIQDPFGSIPASNVAKYAKFLPSTVIRVSGILLFHTRATWEILTKRWAGVVLLANPWWPFCWTIAILCRLRRTPVFFWTHGYTREDRGLRAFLRRVFFRSANGLLLYSTRASQIAARQGIPSERLHVIFNSLDYNAIKLARSAVTADGLSTLRRSLPLPGAPVALCIFRLQPRKRTALALEALRLLRDSHFPVNLVIIGDGPERTHLEQYSRNHQLPTTFCGPLYEEHEVAPYLTMADVVLAPGEIGLTAIHALAYGTPAITHNDIDRQMPEVEAIREGVTGSFHRPEDASHLATVLRAWLSSHKSRETTRRECIAEVEARWTPDSQTSKILSAILGTKH